MSEFKQIVAVEQSVERFIGDGVYFRCRLEFDDGSATTYRYSLYRCVDGSFATSNPQCADNRAPVSVKED